MAAVLIFIFEDDIKAAKLERQESRAQQAITTEAPASFEQPEHNPIWGEPLPGGGIVVTPATTAQAVPPATQAPAVATPSATRPIAAAPHLRAQGPFAFPMPATPQAGYFFVIDFYFPSAPGTGYRIISHERPGDLDFSAIEGNWYLESSKQSQIASNNVFIALQVSQGAECKIDDRIGLTS